MPSSPPLPNFTLTLLPVYLVHLSVKLLLLPAPYSTDLSVHRYWKYLTYHHPLSEWYTDESSKWTLDYPPLFSYFEYVLSHMVTPSYPEISTQQSDDMHTSEVVTIMRLTVLLTEPLLLYSVYQLSTAVYRGTSKHDHTLRTALTVFLPGLTLIDNIHFQYNTLPLSVLLLSMSHFSRKQLHLGAALFSTCLNLKHTLLPLSPVIAIYILSTLYKSRTTNANKLGKLCALAITTFSTLLLPWSPFIANGTYQQALQRMLPFDRGLLHANWAPNLWAPYAAADLLFSALGITIRAPEGSTTSGHINNQRPFAFLPNPTPEVCVALTLLSMVPFLVGLWRNPTGRGLVLSVVGGGLCAFLFGWHVHEKAVLLPLLPLVVGDWHAALIWLSLGGQLALFELLRYPGIVVFLIAHYLSYNFLLFALYGVPRGAGVYLLGCLVIEAYAGVLGGHKLIFGDRMQFLPIMLVSLYSFVGITIAYWKLLMDVLRRKGKTE